MEVDSPPLSSARVEIKGLKMKEGEGIDNEEEKEGNTNLRTARYLLPFLLLLLLRVLYTACTYLPI